MTAPPAKTDVSVLIATHNRAGVLAQTLENLARLDRTDIAVEFVVVDNQSTDDTRATVEKWRDRMPVRYLFEPRAGKNFALNRAIDEIALGEIVAFTDDDVNPDVNWLHAMLSAARRQPDYAVFGGQIRVELPERAPDWAQDVTIQRLAYARHELGDGEKPYPRGRAYPCGANLWLRRELFAAGRRFDETIGPRPGRRFMGSESSLLRRLTAEGYDILHVPTAVVGHCIQPDALTVDYVRRRAQRRGTSMPHASGTLTHAKLHARNPVLWRVVRWLSIVRWLVRFGVSQLSFSATRRLANSLGPRAALAAEFECLRLASMDADAMRADRADAAQPS